MPNRAGEAGRVQERGGSLQRTNLETKKRVERRGRAMGHVGISGNSCTAGGRPEEVGGWVVPTVANWRFSGSYMKDEVL